MGTVADVARYFDDEMKMTNLHCWTEVGGRRDLCQLSDLIDYLGDIKPVLKSDKSADLVFRVYPGEGYGVSIGITFPLEKISTYSSTRLQEVEVYGPVREVIVSRNGTVIHHEEEISSPKRFSNFTMHGDFTSLRRAIYRLLTTVHAGGDVAAPEDTLSEALSQSA